MENPLVSVPPGIVILLVAFFTETATDAQRDKLDEWICAREHNMRFFEQCVEQDCQPVIHNPDLTEYEFDFAPIKLN